MYKKSLISMAILLALAFNAFAQNEMTTKIDDQTITDTMAAKIALNVGDKMPSFVLNDANNNKVSSNDLLEQGNLVLVFYRGAWCPFCNLYLKSLQKNIDQIKANGGVLVAVSVENPDYSMTVSKKNELSFTVLSDPKLEIARKFKIVYQLSPNTNVKYKTYGIDLVKQNNTETPDLPLSATYIVNQNGEITYALLDPDYKKRAEPAVIIENLAKMKTSKATKK